MGNWSCPAVLVIATVGVDGAQCAGIGGYLQLVLEGMTGQGGMVYFYVPVLKSFSNQTG